MKIAIGISGGVDSAVSAKRLKEAGHEVVGVHLVCWPPRSEVERSNLTRAEWIKKNGCRADEDRAAALKTALEIGIPFRVLDFSEEYNKRVVNYFYREYEAGRTPNPDVLCNSEIKFGLFLEWAIENGFDKIATGHYAKIVSSSMILSKNGNVNDSSESLRSATQLADPCGDQVQQASVNFSTETLNTQHCLQIPCDTHKDQTYFLWKLTQKELSRVVFPLGDFLKSEVREMAEKFGLSVAKRPDSQGICFVGNVEAREFLARRLREIPGEVKNVQGEVLGKHSGVWFYTIGQRGGWELTPAAQRKYAPHGETPTFYVVSKDAKNNELVVGFGAETYTEHFGLSELNWQQEGVTGKMQVRIRHTGKLLDCKFDGQRVELAEPQRGVAAGQSAVFYKDGVVLGGGVIE